MVKSGTGFESPGVVVKTSCDLTLRKLLPSLVKLFGTIFETSGVMGETLGKFSGTDFESPE